MENDIYVGTNNVVIISKKLFQESVYNKKNNIKNSLILNFRKENLVLDDYVEMKKLNIRDFIESLIRLNIIKNLLEYLYNLIRVFEGILTNEERAYIFTLLEQEEMQ